MDGVGWKAEEIRATLDELGKTLHGIQFKPPPTDDWWGTVASKGATFQAVRFDAEQAFAHLQEGLGSHKASLETLDRAISAQAEEVARSKVQLEAQAKGLDQEYAQVQSLIAGVAKPLAAVAMEPATVVRYAPAIFASALVYFLLRYRALRRGRQSLSQACRDLGYSERAVNAYFDDATEPLNALPSSWHGRGLPRLDPGLLTFFIPGLLAKANAARILASPSLKHQAPWGLYALTLLAMAAAYVLVSRLFAFPAPAARTA